MKIEVQHLKRDGAGWEPVALVTIPDGFTLEAALEFAYYWTNNVEGSWSKSQWAEDARNWDWNPNVEVLKPIMTLNGVKYGHRSSMVGDRFILDDGTHKSAYEVMPSGFRRIAP